MTKKYEDYLKNFVPQHEDVIIHQNHSGTTIVHVLQDTCENCSYCGRSVVVWQSFVSVDVSIFVKMEKSNIDDRHNKILRTTFPNDFFLFLRLKVRLGGHRFSSNEKIWHRLAQMISQTTEFKWRPKNGYNFHRYLAKHIDCSTKMVSTSKVTFSCWFERQTGHVIENAKAQLSSALTLIFSVTQVTWSKLTWSILITWPVWRWKWASSVNVKK